MSHRLLLLMVLAVAGHGCAEPDAGSDLALEAPIFVTAAGDTVRLEEELRIGVLDGPDEYTFSAINWTLPTHDGGVILYDLEGDDGYGQNGRIRQFDAAGKFVRYIGRPGEGPGEYGPFPTGTRLVDGALAFYDQGLSRITRYDTSGAVVGSWPGPTGMVDITPTADGGWYVSAVNGYEEGLPRRIEYVRYSGTGQELSRAAAPRHYHNGPWGEARAMTVILPDGRMVSGRTDSLMFTVTSALGETRVQHRHEPVAYLPQERADLADRYAQYSRGQNGTGVSPSIPEYKPAYSYMITDPEGRIMFRMRTRSYPVADTTTLREGEPRWRSPFELEVFDSSLAYRGRLVAPRPVSRFGASLAPGAVWLVHEGEAGELYLVKWESPGPVW